MSVPVDVGRPFRGRVFRYGDHVNTDVIFPGRYTYTKSRPEEVAPHALEDLDPTFVERVRPGDVIVAGWNWGCGSSREQAAVCLRYAGVGAVVARSFGRIFYRNALNNGLLAIVCPEAVDALEDGVGVEVDLEASVIRCLGRSTTAWPSPAPSPFIQRQLDRIQRRINRELRRVARPKSAGTAGGARGDSFRDSESGAAASVPGNVGNVLTAPGPRARTFCFASFSPAVRSMIAAGGLIEQTRRRLAAGAGAP